MLQLLSPAGLGALAALALPLAIHLWRPPGRTVRLGSLRFLESLPRPLRDLRWRERLLLAARLALLALLALLLAGPRWQRQPPRGPRRWALVDPAAGFPSEGSARQLRALEASGYERRAFAPGFPRWSAPPGGRTPAVFRDPPDLWSMLREADAELPAGSLLAVFSPGLMASLHGARPALTHCRVSWMRARVAAPFGTPSPTDPTPGKSPEVLILCDPDRAGEARYVAAAVRAAAAGITSPPNVQTGAANPPAGPSRPVDWLFWLSGQPWPGAWSQRAAGIVTEEPALAQTAGALASWIVPLPGATGGSDFLDPVRLWRRAAPASNAPGAAAWVDGFGASLLTVEPVGGTGRRWRFYGRFDPAWNDLPHRALAIWMRRLLFGRDDPTLPQPMAGSLQADPSQYRPVDAPARSPLTLPRVSEDSVDLRGAAWMLAAMLFALERAFSHRRRPAPAALPSPPPLAVSR